MLEIIVFSSGVGLLLAAYGLYKIRKIHLMQFRLFRQLNDVLPRQIDTQFRQLEALLNLQAEMDLPGSLPPTRGWAASPDFLVAIAAAARELRPQFVVECSSGASTIVLARCLQRNGSGHVYSLEHDPVFAAKTRADLTRLGLLEWATVIDAPLSERLISDKKWLWYATDGLPAELVIDLLIIDGPPMDTQALARYPAGPLLFPHLSVGARVFLDDADRPDERTIVQRWVAEFAGVKETRIEAEKGCVVIEIQGQAQLSPWPRDYR